MASNQNKVALITGASSGIGKATAKALLERGYTVYVAARRVARMQELEDEGAIALKMDITKEEDIQAVVDHIREDHGGVDILVNNAGFGMYGSVEETTIEDARYQFEVNLFGLARLTQLVLPHMRENGWGKIVNISSVGGKIYTPLGAWYHATKHALEGWSDALRLEVASFGIDVAIIEPGLIGTEFGDVMVDPMLQRSGSGPYQELAHTVARVTKENYDNGASPPTVVADAIAHAVTSSRPRTRYAVGRLAKPLLFIRRYFSDKFFDRAVMSQAN